MEKLGDSASVITIRELTGGSDERNAMPLFTAQQFLSLGSPSTGIGAEGWFWSPLLLT